MQVEFEHRIECVGNFHEPQAGVDVTKMPTERQTQTLRRSASGTWTMTEEMKKKLQATQRRMMRMVIQTTKKKPQKRNPSPQTPPKSPTTNHTNGKRHHGDPPTKPQRA